MYDFVYLDALSPPHLVGGHVCVRLQYNLQIFQLLPGNRGQVSRLAVRLEHQRDGRLFASDECRREFDNWLNFEPRLQPADGTSAPQLPCRGRALKTPVEGPATNCSSFERRQPGGQELVGMCFGQVDQNLMGSSMLEGGTSLVQLAGDRRREKVLDTSNHKAWGLFCGKGWRKCKSA
ncbi:uncharacterized protein BKA78DRAFT_310487 [Phyllosticta capitalensis]|uniref:uncharacterized protein n=1 Tax=Phyllosticta capitalensis TaxID=121624 RepID=UPI0031307665